MLALVDATACGVSGKKKVRVEQPASLTALRATLCAEVGGGLRPDTARC